MERDLSVGTSLPINLTPKSFCKDTLCLEPSPSTYSHTHIYTLTSTCPPGVTFSRKPPWFSPSSQVGWMHPLSTLLYPHQCIHHPVWSLSEHSTSSSFFWVASFSVTPPFPAWPRHREDTFAFVGLAEKKKKQMQVPCLE